MRNLQAQLLLAATLLMYSCFADAQGLSKTDAANEMSAEYAACYAFYSAGITCFGSGGPLKGDERISFEAARDTAAEREYIYGKLAGASHAALVARGKIALKSVMGDMNGNCVNVAVVLDKYAQSCKSLMQDPNARALQLMTKGR